MSDYGFHWTPCRRGGGGGGRAVLVVLAVVVIAACARPAIAAALDVLEFAAIAVGVLAVLAVAVAVWRSRRGRAIAAAEAAGAELAARPVVLRAVAEPGQVGRAAIGPPRSYMSAYPHINVNAPVATSDDAVREGCPYESCHHNHPELPPPWERPRKEGDRNG